MSPMRKVFSASVASMRVFQNLRPSGRPSRSRGPGKSSRKKSASCSSKEQSPLGTTLSCRDARSDCPDCGKHDSGESVVWAAKRWVGAVVASGPRSVRGRFEIMPEILGHVAGSRVPFGRPLGDCLQANPLELAGNGVVDLAGRAWLGADDLTQDMLGRVAAKRPAAGQQFVENNPDAEDVGPTVDEMALAAGLFGAGVGHRSREPRTLAVVFILHGQPEVGQIGHAEFIDQDVGRLDVAMEEVAGMGIVHRVAEGRDDPGRLRECGAAGLEPGGQIAPVHVHRDDEAQAVFGVADVVHRHDVGMREPGEHSRFVQIKLEIPGRYRRTVDRYLDGDLAAKVVVACQEDASVRALTQRPDHLIATDVRRVGLGCALRVLTALMQSIGRGAGGLGRVRVFLAGLDGSGVQQVGEPVIGLAGAVLGGGSITGPGGGWAPGGIARDRVVGWHISQAHQIRTRCSGASQSLSPSLTPKAE